MTEAGWYPDPTGRAAVRYWDGTQWTAYESGAPAAPPAPAPAAGDVAPEDAGAEVDVPRVGFTRLDTTVRLGLGRSKPLVVDEHAITWGGTRFPYDQIRSFGHVVTRHYMNGVPTNITFELWLDGRKAVAFGASGHKSAKAQAAMQTFSGTVAPLYEFVAPRLVSWMLQTALAGSPVVIGSLSLDRQGVVRSGKVRADLAVAWPQVAGTSTGGGSVTVWRFEPSAKKGQKQIGSVRLVEPNAPLLPDLVAELKARYAG